MTRLPHPNRNVIDRPDLPEYELNEECAAPGCHLAREPGGGHHCWRRSFGTKSWWVELADGTVVGNRVGLCNGHHELVTTNNARIVYNNQTADGVFSGGSFWWLYHGEVGNGHELDWQPPTQSVQDAVIASYEDGLYDAYATVGPPPQPGETCVACRRRVPHKAKASTPKSKVWSTRVPLEAETFSELVDAAAEHHGLTSKPYHRYLCLLFGVTLLLQAEKGDLPVG